MRLIYCPLQAAYGVTLADGMISTELDGGAARTRTDILGGPNTVQATWVLREEDFNVFMGFWRLWRNSGGTYFDIDLPVESGEVDSYQASFIPGNTINWTKNGEAYTIVAPLWVLPLDKYIDGGDDDYYAILAWLLGEYGSWQYVNLALDLFYEIVVVNLPHMDDL